MSTPIFDEFLNNSDQAGQELARAGGVLRLGRFPVRGAGVWFARFAVPFLSRDSLGAVSAAPGPLTVTIHFGPGYLNQVSPLEVVQVQQAGFFHPNFRWPVLCVGEIRPGMPLPQLLRHVYEIVTYQNYATEHGLNPDACRRLCEQPQLLDLLPRRPPLVRRRLELTGEGA